MEGRGVQTKMPRAALPRSGESGDAIIMLVATGVAMLFAAIQIGFALTMTPLMIALYERAEIPLPAFLAFADSLGLVGLFLVLAVFNTALFFLFVWLAKRYWVGLLFAPPVIYVATTFGLFIGLVGGSAAAALAT